MSQKKMDAVDKIFEDANGLKFSERKPTKVWLKDRIRSLITKREKRAFKKGFAMGWESFGTDGKNSEEAWREYRRESK